MTNTQQSQAPQCRRCQVISKFLPMLKTPTKGLHFSCPIFWYLPGIIFSREKSDSLGTFLITCNFQVIECSRHESMQFESEQEAKSICSEQHNGVLSDDER